MCCGIYLGHLLSTIQWLHAVWQVMQILGQSAMIERASVDECYLDLTEVRQVEALILDTPWIS